MAHCHDTSLFQINGSFWTYDCDWCTSCNVSGDNAIGVIVETIYQKFINKSSASV